MISSLAIKKCKDNCRNYQIQVPPLLPSTLFLKLCKMPIRLWKQGFFKCHEDPVTCKYLPTYYWVDDIWLIAIFIGVGACCCPCVSAFLTQDNINKSSVVNVRQKLAKEEPIPTLKPLISCLLTFFLPCVGICMLRQQAREKYQIDVSRLLYKHNFQKDVLFVFALQGTEFIQGDDLTEVPDMLEDVVLSCCCGCCALAQVAKEAQERAGKPVNLQII